MVCYCCLFKNLPQFLMISTVSNFSVVSEAEVGVLLELSCFFYDPMDVGNLISGSTAFSKSSLNIWKIFKLGLEKSEEPEDKLPTSIGSQKKQENSKKTSTSASLTTLKPLTHNTKWKILQGMGIPDHLTCFLRNLYAG